MINDYKIILEDPENVPVVPQYLKEMIQARLSPTFQMLQGTQDYLKAKGHGPEFILGFLNGLQQASEMFDTWETIAKYREEDNNVLESKG